MASTVPAPLFPLPGHRQTYLELANAIEGFYRQIADTPGRERVLLFRAGAAASRILFARHGIACLVHIRRWRSNTSAGIEAGVMPIWRLGFIQVSLERCWGIWTRGGAEDTASTLLHETVHVAQASATGSAVFATLLKSFGGANYPTTEAYLSSPEEVEAFGVEVANALLDVGVRDCPEHLAEVCTLLESRDIGIFLQHYLSTNSDDALMPKISAALDAADHPYSWCLGRTGSLA